MADPYRLRDVGPAYHILFGGLNRDSKAAKDKTRDDRDEALTHREDPDLKEALTYPRHDCKTKRSQDGFTLDC